MRTAIIIGCLCIADSITRGSYSFETSDGNIFFIIVATVCILMDVVEFFHKLLNKK